MSRISSGWNFTNPGPEAIFVWLEPWADEFHLPPGSSVQFNTPKAGEIGEIEQAQDQITVWADAETVQVLIDGQLQESASATIPVPRGLSKAMLHVVFADQPSARLGGANRDSQRRNSLWERVKRRFGY